MKTKHWYDYLWIWTALYFILGFFNILFAWLGMIDFLVPLGIAIFGKSKAFCNTFCGRSQLFSVLGGKLGLSHKKCTPKWMHSAYFRYGFLAFFMTMFLLMVYNTWLVFGGIRTLSETVKLFWTFRVPWDWAYTAGAVSPWIAQYAFGFYSIMLTSTLIGLLLMALYRPRTWCAFCPMGTMTQSICKLQNKEK